MSSTVSTTNAEMDAQRKSMGEEYNGETHAPELRLKEAGVSFRSAKSVLQA